LKVYFSGRKEDKLQEATEFIKSVGFPVFVAVYLLVRLEPRMKEVAEIQAQLLEYLRKKNGS